jgi:spoIIIJ-associated protein
MGRVQEWVEAAGSTVDIAVAAALAELGLGSRDEADIEIISEGKPGILGSGWRAQEAIVKVTAKPPKQRTRRRRGGRTRSGQGDESEHGGEGRAASDSTPRQSSTTPRSQKGRSGGRDSGSRTPQKSDSSRGSRGGRSRSAQSATENTPSPDRAPGKRQEATSKNTSGRRNGPGEEPTIEEQATIAAEFLRGLLKAFGLEGEVTTTVDEEEELLKIEVTGDQTEALVGRKGAVMHSVLEITRTVVQRKTFGAPRMRLDINGYGERRREALTIYAGRQAERVLADAGEIMLEPMNAADRKVVHDAIAEIAGVRSFSEGEDPERAVVIAAAADE